MPRGRVKARHRLPTPGELERQRIDAQYQAAVKNFDAAIRAFQRQNYERAMEVFEKLAGSEFPEIADRARVHLRLCEQKVSRSGPAPKTAEEHYTLGVAALNARELDRAVEHLSKADKLRPKRDHIRYALASVHALLGNVDAALEQLEVAIKLRPANRFQARRDEDFQGLASDPRFRRLVYPELY
jgi:tetratricopeptide (TPR) repeat protein